MASVRKQFAQTVNHVATLAEKAQAIKSAHQCNQFAADLNQLGDELEELIEATETADPTSAAE